MAEEQVLYERNVPILLKLGTEIQKHPGVHVRVSLQHTRSKTLNVQLTDEQNPFFLFLLQVGEDDFHLLKSQQNLLVDFLQFPLKFVELLNSCLECSKDDHPKFAAHLTHDSSSRFASLNILESNSFKQIVHLTLQFIPGNDSDIKDYLALVTKHLKNDNSTLKANIISLQDSLDHLKQRYSIDSDKYSQQTSQMDKSHSEAISQLQLKLQTEIGLEREKHSKELQLLNYDTEKQRREIETNYESQVLLVSSFYNQIKTLSTKITSLTTTNSHLFSQIQTLEVNLSNSSKNCESLNKDVSLLRTDIEKANMTIKITEKERYQLTQENNMLKESNSSLLSKNAHYHDSLLKLEIECETYKSKKNDIQQTCDQLSSEVNELDESLTKTKDEIIKANEIIKKLQEEVKSTKSKIKLKNALVFQQERLLEERAQMIESFQTDQGDSKTQIKQLNDALLESKQFVDTLTQTLEEKKQTILDNANVIEWLHKQLNEQTLGRNKDQGIGSQREKSPFPKASVDENEFDEKRYTKSSPTSQFKSSILKSTDSLKSKFATSVMAGHSSTQKPRPPLKPPTTGLPGTTSLTNPSFSNLKSNYF